jgi:hypothetical protein
MMLDVSDDGGATWRAQPTKSLGPRGVRTQRIIWNSLGSSEKRIYRIAVSDPVKVAISDAVLNVRGGRV